MKSPSGGYETYSFDELFRNLELLADVPAVENPEFNQAVAEMVQGGSKQKQDKPSGKESITPPPSERPEVSDMPLAGKTKKEAALELAAKGMKAPDIARKIGAKYSTVYNWLNPEKCRPKKKEAEVPVDYKNPDAAPGWNADRKKCRSCRYRARPEQVNRCDYIEIAKHSRGCDVEDCDRYVRGRRLKVFRKNMHDSGYRSKI